MERILPLPKRAFPRPPGLGIFPPPSRQQLAILFMQKGPVQTMKVSNAPLRNPLFALAPLAPLAPLRPRKPRFGFTLVELLTVLALIALLSVLVAPALRGIQGAQNATTAAYELEALLRQARGYAMAENTHVFVGILEEDAGKSLADRPPRTGIGRVVVAVVASCNGTKGYDYGNSPQSSWTRHYANGANLKPICNLRKFENLHLAASLGQPPATGAMARPDVNYYYRLGHSKCSSVTPITWPLGSNLNSGFQYRFEKVIRFDPSGTPRIQYKTNGNTIVEEMEIGLQETHGNLWQGLPTDPNRGNHSAILIDGITGTTRIYRPM